MSFLTATNLLGDSAANYAPILPMLADCSRCAEAIASGVLPLCIFSLLLIICNLEEGNFLSVAYFLLLHPSNSAVGRSPCVSQPECKGILQINPLPVKVADCSTEKKHSGWPIMLNAIGDFDE